MAYWYYKAYDADEQTVESVINTNDIARTILELRQNGLQVYEYGSIGKEQYLLTQRINKLQRLQARRKY